MLRMLRMLRMHLLLPLPLPLPPMRRQVFAPGELLPPGYLYIIHRGIALYDGRVLTAGRAWGTDVILSCEELKKNISARAMNYVEVRAECEAVSSEQ